MVACSGYTDTITTTGTFFILPQNVKAGQTAFWSVPAEIQVAGPAPTGVFNIVGVGPGAVEIQGVAAGTATLTLKMADGTECSDVVITVNDAGGGTCLNPTLSPGTITPDQVRSGSTQFEATGSIVQGQTGVNFTNDTPTSVDVSCTGSTQGSMIFRYSDGVDCTAQFNCNGSAPLLCNPSLGDFDINQGATFSASSFVAGGSQPYLITGLAGQSGGFSFSSLGLTANAITAPGTYEVDVTIQDNAGNSVTCTHNITVVATGNCSTEVNTPSQSVNDRTITLSVPTDECNCAGHYVQWSQFPSAGQPTLTLPNGGVGHEIAVDVPVSAPDGGYGFRADCCTN